MSMYNIYIEGQQRDAYVAKKAVEEERARIAEVERKNNSFQNALHHGNNDWFGDDSSKNAVNRIADKRNAEIKKANDEARNLMSHNKQMRDYIDANRKTSNIFTKKGRESKKNIDEYREVMKDNSKKINELEKSKPQYVSEYDPDIHRAIRKHNKKHPDAKLESGIFAECVLI